jgi:argininosuccinate lyase
MHSFDEIMRCLAILVPFISGLKINSERAKQLLSQGHILATDIANLLTLEGMNFRDAYSEVSRLVEKADALGISIEEYLRKEDAQSPLLQKIAKHVSFEKSVEARNFSGGTSSQQIQTSLNQLRGSMRKLLAPKKEVL